MSSIEALGVDAFDAEQRRDDDHAEQRPSARREMNRRPIRL